MAHCTLGEENQHFEGCEPSSITNTSFKTFSWKITAKPVVSRYYEHSTTTLVSQHWHFVQ